MPCAMPWPRASGATAHAVDRADSGWPRERQVRLSDRLTIERCDVAVTRGPARAPMQMELANQPLLVLGDLPVQVSRVGESGAEDAVVGQVLDRGLEPTTRPRRVAGPSASDRSVTSERTAPPRSVPCITRYVGVEVADWTLILRTLGASAITFSSEAVASAAEKTAERGLLMPLRLVDSGWGP